MMSQMVSDGSVIQKYCAWCQGYKQYSQAGYLPPGTSRYQEGLEPDYPTKPLLEAMEETDSCLLCGKISAHFRKWAMDRYGSMEAIQLSKGRVTFEATYPKRLPEDGERFDDYTGYGDDGVHGRLCFVTASISINDPDSPGSVVGPALALQRAADQPPSVADVFHLSDDAPLSWPETEPYMARARPLIVDGRLFRKWKDLCTAAHEGLCGPARIDSAQEIPMIRLIDVMRSCLVERPSRGTS